MRVYTELWQYVKVTIVEITKSIQLTRATILLGHKIGRDFSFDQK